ncbi:MAG TPA: arginine repressor [Vulgatibacter sp.]|nr:arginine repressor [Vulgatibacter sp.]
MPNDIQEARRAAITQIVRTRRVGTQEELRRLLAESGFDVTQATLSRDLSRLKARRVSLPEGGTMYEVGEFEAPADPDELEQAGVFVTSVESNDVLIVVHTRPGAAPAVASALDKARLPQLLGTIAGDDTIFLAPVRRQATKKLEQFLLGKWKKGGS